VQHHTGELANSSGAFILVLDSPALVSVPRTIVSAVALRADQFIDQAIRDVDALSRLLVPATVTRVIGPARLNYVDRSCFVPMPTGNTRELMPRDEAPFLAMRAACPPDEWEPKEFSLGLQPTFGTFGANGELVAVAGTRVWAEPIAHISVVARPGFRDQGFGTRAVAAATSRALDIGLLPQYRVLESNAQSRRVAHKLGFQSYGWTVSVRLAQT
jgi:RimJ/RimL family protein N-acetyltransferase